MNNIKCSLCFFILVSGQLFGQNITASKEKVDDIYKLFIKSKKQNKTQSISLLNELLDLSDTTKGTEVSAYIYHKQGLIYEKSRAYQNAITQYEKAIKIRQGLTPINFYYLNNSRYNMSNCYGKLNKTTEQFKVIDTIIKDRSDDKFHYRAKNTLAKLKAKKGDYFLALDIYENVISSHSIYKDTLTLFKGHIGAIHVYSKMDQQKINLERINYHENEVEKLLLKKPYLRNKMSGFNNNLGRIYEDFNEYPQALNAYEKALARNAIIGDSVKMGQIYLNIGNVYNKQKKTKIGYNYYDKALRITDSKNIVADVYLNKGYYLVTNNSINKLPYYKNALKHVLQDAISLDNLPKLEQIINSEYEQDILFYLNDIANCLVSSYEEDGKVIHLEKAREILILVDKIISHIRFDSFNNKSKLFWIKRGVSSYMLGVKICYLLKDKERLFYFMEKNKSLLLLESLNEQEVKLKENIPLAILQKVARLRNDKIKASKNFRLNPKNEVLRKALVKSEDLVRRFSDSIKNKYPDYFEIKKRPEILSLKKTIETHVTKDANFIEYILDDVSGYGIFCSHAETVIFKLKDVPELIKQLKELRQKTRAPFTYAKDFEDYGKLSFSVFSKLFPFKDGASSISKKILTIVPDYKLQYLPFEALITKSNSNDLSKDYLIQQTEVSYSQSASVFRQIDKKKQTNKQNFIGIAPVFYNYDSLPILRKSEMEMSQISSLFPSKVLLKEKAVKQSFIANLNTYNIIHLNTHAGLKKNGEPWVAFSDSKLDVKELYGLNNQAALVVLDACKTADGTLNKGEGIMSLSRGFFYGGAKSVIASLWNINEQSNNEILVSFYKNLVLGEKKSKSLHNAKLSYLNTHQNSELSPYYWSSMVLTGDTQSLEIKSNNLWIKVLSVSLVLVVLLLILLRRNNFLKKYYFFG